MILTYAREGSRSILNERYKNYPSYNERYKNIPPSTPLPFPFLHIVEKLFHIEILRTPVSYSNKHLSPPDVAANVQENFFELPKTSVSYNPTHFTHLKIFPTLNGNS